MKDYYRDEIIRLTTENTKLNDSVQELKQEYVCYRKSCSKRQSYKE